MLIAISLVYLKIVTEPSSCDVNKNLLFTEKYVVHGKVSRFTDDPFSCNDSS